MSGGNETTPRPWTFDNRRDPDEYVFHVIQDSSAAPIASVYASIMNTGYANAELICRAVNGHDGLVEALRTIEMETRDGGQWTLAEVNEAARAALKQSGAS